MWQKFLALGEKTIIDHLLVKDFFYCLLADQASVYAFLKNLAAQ